MVAGVIFSVVLPDELDWTARSTERVSPLDTSPSFSSPSASSTLVRTCGATSRVPRAVVMCIPSRKETFVVLQAA